MEALIVIYIIGFLGVELLGAVQLIDGPSSPEARRDAAREKIVAPVWPVVLLIGIGYGIKELFDIAEWNGKN